MNINIASEVGNWNGLPPLTSARTLISRGRLEALHFVPFHANGAAPVSRRVLAGAGVHEAIGKHIVSHEIRDVPTEHRSYCEPHVHDCDEINILLSDSHLSYEIRLGDEVFRGQCAGDDSYSCGSRSQRQCHRRHRLLHCHSRYRPTTRRRSPGCRKGPAPADQPDEMALIVDDQRLLDDADDLHCRPAGDC